MASHSPTLINIEHLYWRRALVCAEKPQPRETAQTASVKTVCSHYHILAAAIVSNRITDKQTDAALGLQQLIMNIQK